MYNTSVVFSWQEIKNEETIINQLYAQNENLAPKIPINIISFPSFVTMSDNLYLFACYLSSYHEKVIKA